MAPIYIADSDDEGENGDCALPPSPPLAPIADVLALLDHSTNPNTATSSTDSTLFRKVFNEQNEAAHEQGVHNVGKDVMASTRGLNPLQEPVEGLDPLSVISFTDSCPQNHKALLVSTPMDERIQPRPQAPDPEDIWEVPTSPSGSNHAGISIRTNAGMRATKGAAVSVIQGSKVDLRSDDTDAPSTWDTGTDDQTRSLKRRRLGDSQVTSEVYNDAELVAFPQGNDALQLTLETNVASSMPWPTMPLESDTSFYIASKALTESQKLQYHSMHLESSGDAMGVLSSNRPLHTPNMVCRDASSGSATNINTSRTDIGSSHDLSFAPFARMEIEQAPKVKEYGSLGMRRNSSPDAIALTGPESDGNRVDKHDLQDDCAMATDTVTRPMEEISGVDIASPLATTAAESPHQHVPPDDDEESDYAPKQKIGSKSKRGRGRPKKTAALEETPVKDAEPLPITPVTTKEKKKRGRPKRGDKSKKPEPPQQPTDEFNVEDVNGNETVKGDDTHMHRQSADLEVVEAKPVLAVMKRDVTSESTSSVREEETAVYTDTPKSKTGPKTVSATSATSAEPESPNKEEEAQPKAQTRPQPQENKKKEESNKAGSLKKTLSTPVATKPIYRVGLSKRSKIAPLLKSLRK